MIEIPGRHVHSSDSTECSSSTTFRLMAEKGRPKLIRAKYIEQDKTGVQDFVLLEDFKNETAFVQNLKVRFEKNLIYV